MVRSILLEKSEMEQMPQKNFASYFLLGLLIVSSFLIGSLYTRVRVLEKNLPGQSISGQVAGVRVQADAGEKALPTVVPTIGLELNDNIKPAKDDHINGNTNARILLFEYSDMECPYCKKFHPIAQQVVDSYNGKVAWVYRHFPLSFHANAQKEAEASECANELGGNTAFWKYINTLFARTSSGGEGFPLTDLVPLAGEIGLNEAKFKKCLDSDKYAERVKNDIQTGRDAGISGTPGNILFDTKTGKSKSLPGAYPFEEFKKVIDEIIKVS